MATFNVWFGERSFEARAQAMSRLLCATDADVIGLQEVTPPFLAVLRQSTWAQDYAWSTQHDEAVSPYGNLLLSRLPVVGFERTPLWSYQGRHLNVVTLQGGLCIATVHLESRRASAEIRETQLSEIFKRLQGQTRVLMGDFNFDPAANEQALIPAEYGDVWAKLWPLADGFTVDTDVNEMAAADKQKSKAVRFDRILLSSDTHNAVSITRLGVAPFNEGIWPSDHFGLAATIQRTRG